MEIDKMVEQLDVLISDYQELLATRGDTALASDRAKLLASRLESAIDRLAVPGSSYVQQLDLYRTEKRVKYKIREIYSIALGLRDDLKAGWTTSVMELVHADTHSDYLEMAETLLAAGYKDPAAVITGTSLEVHVRTLCTKHGVDTELPSGAPKKADAMNTELKKAGVYNEARKKQITAWMDLRNKAAHGDYASYDEQQVRMFIVGVRDFFLKYPA
ncbi:hypothetical protein GCM10010330_15820 [Streptomyces tendae]|uniref:hypothetical protein n=1 Tax=Streptomyces tendae TaxID=1932 RepID=UPI0019A03104|nr:hypothetical protein [Streptomyces tendae]GHA63858.1 hypothetical protein GCM10010330_15820 [Streptomyces tendae]